MDDRLMARHGRFGQELDELERSGRYPEPPAHPHALATGEIWLALLPAVWLGSNLRSIVSGGLELALAIDSPVLDLALFVVLILTFAEAMKLLVRRYRRAGVAEADTPPGRTSLDKGLCWWFRGTRFVWLFIAAGFAGSGAAGLIMGNLPGEIQDSESEVLWSLLFDSLRFLLHFAILAGVIWLAGRRLRRPDKAV